MKRLSRAGEWLIAIVVIMIVFIWMAMRSTSKEGWAAQRLALAKELCAVPGSSGVDINVSHYYGRRHPQLKTGEVSFSEKWAWYRSQLDGYTSDELRSAGCSDETVGFSRTSEARTTLTTNHGGVTAVEPSVANNTAVGCTSDPRAVFSLGQRVSGAEVARRLELHCPGARVSGTTAVVLHNGQKLAVELEPVQPFAHGYYTIRRITQAP